MKWILWIIVAWIGLDGIIIFLMHLHIEKMAKMGYRYNYDEERWEKRDETDRR